MKNRYRSLPTPTKVDPENPWKFYVGTLVYCWGFPGELSFRIVDRLQLGPANFPHYLIESIEGDKWTVPQMHLSRNPIPHHS